MKILIPIDARLLVNNVEYKGIGTGLFAQLRLASDETTVKSTGTEIETSGVYEFEITGTALTSYLELWICATENGTYTKVKSWGGTDGIRQKEYLSYVAVCQIDTNATLVVIELQDEIGLPSPTLPAFYTEIIYAITAGSLPTNKTELIIGSIGNYEGTSTLKNININYSVVGTALKLKAVNNANGSAYALNSQDGTTFAFTIHLYP